MILGLLSPGNFPRFKDGLRTTAGSFPRLLFFAGVSWTSWKEKNGHAKFFGKFLQHQIYRHRRTDIKLQTHNHADRQTDRQTNRQTNRQTWHIL